MSSAARISGILCATVVLLVSAQNKPSCLKYLNSCAEGSSNCCNFPAVSCLPDKKNGTSCLSIYDMVNLNPLVTGMAAFQPLLHNATGFLAEAINVNGKNVYNTTETFTPKPHQNPKPVSTTKPTHTTKPQEPSTHKPQEHVEKHESSTHKPN